MSAALAEPFPNPGRPDQYLDQAALILDDCEFDRLKLRRLIQDAGLPFDLVEVDTLEAMDAALTARDFDLVLIDFFLVGGTGFEALKLLQQKARKTPVSIMITGDEQTEIAVRAMKMGCSDYLSKAALSAERLKTAVYEAQAGAPTWTHHHEDRLKAVEVLTGRMVSRYSNSVQPELARIVRELREMKSDLEGSQGSQPDQLEEVERRYCELWGQLRDPDTYRRNQH